MRNEADPLRVSWSQKRRCRIASQDARSPAQRTYVINIWAFDIGMSAGQLGMGAAVALTMLPALAVLIVGLTIYLRRE